jgi:hypothetical protein
VETAVAVGDATDADDDLGSAHVRGAAEDVVDRELRARDRQLVSLTGYKPRTIREAIQKVRDGDQLGLPDEGEA